MQTTAGDGHLEAVEEECKLLSQGGAGKRVQRLDRSRGTLGLARVGLGRTQVGLLAWQKREGGKRDEIVTCHRAIKVCHEAGIVGKP